MNTFEKLILKIPNDNIKLFYIMKVKRRFYYEPWLAWNRFVYDLKFLFRNF